MNTSGKRIIIWDDIVMMILALVSGYILLLQFTTDLAPSLNQLLSAIDLGIAGIFLLEFVIKLSIAKSKSAFLRSNWWYLLASIPITNPTTQALRLLRLIRLTRLFRLKTGGQELLSYVGRFVEETYVIYVITSWLVIVSSGTLIFYSFERGINPNVHNLFDSLWYVIATITTVGYGDISPATVGGRIIGILLMIIGVSMTGLLTAIIASFFIKQNERK